MLQSLLLSSNRNDLVDLCLLQKNGFDGLKYFVHVQSKSNRPILTIIVLKVRLILIKSQFNRDMEN